MVPLWFRVRRRDQHCRGRLDDPLAVALSSFGESIRLTSDQRAMCLNRLRDFIRSNSNGPHIMDGPLIHTSRSETP